MVSVQKCTTTTSRKGEVMVSVQQCTTTTSRKGEVMVSVLTFSVVDRELKPRSVQAKDY